VLDVQAWDWLQQDLKRMLDQTREKARNRLSPEAFKAKFIGATAEFLEIDAEATSTFEAAVNKAITEIDQARTDMLRQKTNSESEPDETAAMLASRAGWAEYGQAQRRAVRHPLAVLQARPRHELLRETMLKWLLRLNYGMGAAASR
jgi:ABC-type nitrate/sulfonate/bicarbonate transport system substrate-binding protein